MKPIQIAGLALCSFLTACSSEIVETQTPQLIGRHSELAYKIIRLADGQDNFELSNALTGASYFEWIEGDARPQGRPARPDDIPSSTEGPCKIDRLIERARYSVTAEWNCDAYDIELSSRFVFGPSGRLMAVEREIPRWVTEV